MPDRAHEHNVSDHERWKFMMLEAEREISQREDEAAGWAILLGIFVAVGIWVAIYEVWLHWVRRWFQ